MSDPGPSRSDPSNSLASLGIQISSTLNLPFDVSIHDYVTDCTTNPIAEIVVAAPQFIGFSFLGTSGTPGSAIPYEHVRFRQTIALKPGQGFRFGIAGKGSYSIRCLPPDFPPLVVTRNGNPQAQWYLFTPTLVTAPVYYTILTDSYGTPVWWASESGITYYDAKVLGPDQIAWWTGTGRTYGYGAYSIHKFDGTLLSSLTGNLDFHDLQPTAKGTYLSIRYTQRVCPPDCADMSPWGGKSQDNVLDAEIVELDSNSNVVWSWRTRDHIALSETGESGWFPAVAEDIIHMNAVEPDGDDGLIFSARHLNAIYRVIKSTGAIDWKIGGTARPESLTVIGDLRPTAVGLNGQPLSGQHDVRRWSDGTVSVHDNGTQLNRLPAVIRYRLDLTNRTAEVVEDVEDPGFLLYLPNSLCCGSARRLPGGNWLVQWGAAPYLAELGPKGNRVLTIQYNMGGVFSYRAVPVLPGVVAADTLRDGMDAMSRD